MVVDGRDYVVADTETSHSHAPDWGRAKAEETVQNIKKAAATSRASTASVIQAKVSRVSDETAMRLPKFANLKKMVRRVKRRNLPPEPKDLAELEQIPRQFTTTVRGIAGCCITIQKMLRRWSYSQATTTSSCY